MPLLAVFPADIDFDQDLEFFSELLCRSIELLRQPQRIDRIHCGEQFNRFRSFVGLQMTDQMPFGVVQITKSFCLPSEFLHAILAEQAKSSVICGSDTFSRKGLS